MGWRAMLRARAAEARRQEREAHRWHRLLEKKRLERHRMAEFQQAAHDAAEFENRVALLTSVHRECGGLWDWYRVANAPAPAAPVKCGGREERARNALTRFKPSFWDRLFEREESKEANLKDAVRDARQRDEEDYQEELAAYEQTRYDWDASRQFATRVIVGDPVAYHEAIGQAHSFDDISEGDGDRRSR